jgi:hypothetical protein
MPVQAWKIVSMGMEGVEGNGRWCHAKCNLVEIFLQFAGRVWEGLARMFGGGRKILGWVDLGSIWRGNLFFSCCGS